jgi:hypothetical protein
MCYFWFRYYRGKPIRNSTVQAVLTGTGTFLTLLLTWVFGRFVMQIGHAEEVALAAALGVLMLDLLRWKKLTAESASTAAPFGRR